MNDLHLGIVTIHAAKAQINDHLFRRPADIFEQDVICSSCAERM